MTSLPAVRRVREDPADFEREITDAALGGAGWHELLGRIHAATGRHCRLVDPRGALLAATDDGAGLSRAEAGRVLAEPRRRVTAEDRWSARAVPAAAGGRVSALLLLAEPAGERQLDFARAALTAVLIESVRRAAAAEARLDALPISRPCAVAPASTTAPRSRPPASVSTSAIRSAGRCCATPAPTTAPGPPR